MSNQRALRRSVMKSKKMVDENGLKDATGKPIGTPKIHVCTIRDIVEMLIVALDVHEGHWAIYAGYNFQATNANLKKDGNVQMVPATLSILSELGIQKVDPGHPMAVDAALVNPVMN